MKRVLIFRHYTLSVLSGPCRCSRYTMIVFLLVPFLVLGVTLAQSDGTLVSTVQGPVQGSLISSSVRQWLGIPYASPPTGTLRFQAPQPAPSRAGTLSTTAFGNSCPAILGTEFLLLVGMLQQQESVPVDEDCLNLNIWAPATSRPQGGAVLLWVYGGSYQFGTSNTPYYNGQTFVENFDDIVIVTINYRRSNTSPPSLNIFGFPNAPQQLINIGLLDIDAAIQWVYANIAAFGGDPDRITIFGESAGAIAVDAYAFSHPDDTIVKGQPSYIALFESTSVSTDSASFSASNSSWNTVASALDCGTAGDAAQLACIQAVPWQTLLNEVISSGESFNSYADGQTLFSDVPSRSADGNFLKVPFLVGTNADEGDIFVVAAEQEDFNFTIPVVTTVLSDAITELLANCPASQEAGDRVSAGVPTWRYIFEGVYPDLTDDNPNLRAYHSSEIPLVFGTYEASTFPYAPTSSEIALSSWMQGAWVAFAQDPGTGLANYGWPSYGSLPILDTLAELGNSNNPGGPTYSAAATFDVGCAVVNVLTPVVYDVISFLGVL
ncbi:alpha/beta-hydrolase [Calocera viscosa TUFC12733]|uniref:Carboxylic ester hydrolase n=1 Tax=Calocera viscosa (strain TUFC12733) TaxID=1330018 RepID=A0A167K265_CALVF|nr:alpha/beta-hydrolase [Calocera viscosa TUFC12733]